MKRIVEFSEEMLPRYFTDPPTAGCESLVCNATQVDTTIQEMLQALWQARALVDGSNVPADMFQLVGQDVGMRRTLTESDAEFRQRMTDPFNFHTTCSSAAGMSGSFPGTWVLDSTVTTDPLGKAGSYVRVPGFVERTEQWYHFDLYFALTYLDLPRWDGSHLWCGEIRWGGNSEPFPTNDQLDSMSDLVRDCRPGHTRHRYTWLRWGPGETYFGMRPYYTQPVDRKVYIQVSGSIIYP